jgi:dTDP-4-dehydrorhamnose 3,5-epimerase
MAAIIDDVAKSGVAEPRVAGKAMGPIEGVATRSLGPNFDLRGSVCEIHRDSWGLATRPVQWDFITTRQNVLRGVHVHRLRYDYMLVLQGRATFGLADLRADSPTFRQSMAFDASGEAPRIVIVPPGVAHGVYAHEPMLYLYGLTAYWDGLDQLGCRFDDPGLNIAWPIRDPILLPRDASLPDFATLLRQFEAAGGVQVGA